MIERGSKVSKTEEYRVTTLGTDGKMTTLTAHRVPGCNLVLITGPDGETIEEKKLDDNEVSPTGAETFTAADRNQEKITLASSED